VTIRKTFDFNGGEVYVFQTYSGHHWNCSCGDEGLDFPNQTKVDLAAQEHADKHNEEN
jgi:hypothetical protein